jgi:hypothetical protein
MTERGVVGRALRRSPDARMHIQPQPAAAKRKKETRVKKARDRRCTYTLRQFYDDAHDHPPRARNFGQEHEMAHQKLKQV